MAHTGPLDSDEAAAFAFEAAAALAGQEDDHLTDGDPELYWAA